MDNPNLTENDFARLDYYFANSTHVSNFPLHADGRSTPDSSDESQGSTHHSLSGSYEIELIDEEGKINLQKKYKIPKPRILRNDFRRYYSNMWVNVFNSCDLALMSKHLNTFYSPNVGVVQADMRYDRMVHPLEIPMYQEQALGVTYLGKFWYAGMNLAPDLVCSIRHTMLKVRSDGTSSIKCAFVLKGTMVSNLNDGKKEDVEKIARYQKLRESGRTDIRDITFTEAAIVAVAPPKIVAVPGGRAEMLFNSKNNNVSSSTLASSDSRMSSPREADRTAAEGNIKLEPSSTTYTKQTPQLSCDSVDSSAMSEDNQSMSSASMLSVGSVSSPSVVASRKRRTRPAPAAGKAEAAKEAKKNTPLTLNTVDAARGTSDVSGRSPKSLPCEDATLQVQAAAQQQKVDWLSLAESAYGAGVLQPCQTHSAKEYYHEEEAPPPSATEMLHDHLGRGQSRSEDPGESSAMDVVEPSTPLGSASPDSEATGVVSEPTGKKIVLTAKIDCICSLELELDKDSVIIGVAVNYFR